MVQLDVNAASTTEIPPNHQPKKPSYVTTANPSKALALAAVGSPVVRVYQDSIPWGGEGRDQAALLALGLVLGDNYFVHPLSDLAISIPADTTAVLITSNGEGISAAAIAENDLAAQDNLNAFVQAGGTLIVDMGEYLSEAGFIAPGAVGTPDLNFPDYPCWDATLAAAALGGDGVPGTPDDHPIVMGPDGIPGTGDGLTDSNIDMVPEYCDIAVGNLLDGITLPGNASVLMTATFAGVQKPILAEYAHGNGKIILDTIAKEYVGHKPLGNGPSFFLLNLLHYGLQLPLPTPPVNDDFDNAIITEPLPFVDNRSTLFATTANDDPDCFGNAATVWYQFTPSQNMRIQASTSGSNYDTTLSVYTGSRGNLSQIACNGNAGSSAIVDVIADTSYYFAVGTHFESLGGQLNFTVDSVVPPANDNFGNATTVTEPLPFVDEISTLFAISEAGDPVDCFGISPTVWYQFTPSQNMRILANAYGSSYDASVSVYTGTHGSLNQIACGIQSIQSFDAVAGNTYYFGIGPYYGGFGGNLRFTVDLGLQVNLSINAKGSVTKAGLVTMSGILKCSKPTSGFLGLGLQQTFIRFNAQGSNGTSIDCLGETPWSMTVTSYTSTVFGAGRANASADGSFWDPVAGNYVPVNASKAISLTGKK